MTNPKYSDFMTVISQLVAEEKAYLVFSVVFVDVNILCKIIKKFNVFPACP